MSDGDIFVSFILDVPPGEAVFVEVEGAGSGRIASDLKPSVAPSVSGRLGADQSSGSVSGGRTGSISQSDSGEVS